jgi:sRNA-binding protein
MDKHVKPLTPVEVERALAMIEKGHQLDGQQLDAEMLDRAKRILTREISSDEARIELREALQAIVESERAGRG